jgi:quinol monooxygenase YgiN
MVLRVVRFLVREHTEAAFMGHLRDLADRSLGTIEGLIQLQVVRSVTKDGAVVVGMGLWRDWDALGAFYGDQLDQPLLFDPYGEWVDSATVEHFEHVFGVGSWEEASSPRL